MKLGILSDTHNNAANIHTALDIFQQEGIARLVHCGDITTPDMILLFKGWQVTFVYGNIDKLQAELADAARQIGLQPPQRIAQLTIGGVPIAVTHGHDGLQRLIGQQAHHYILHGHTHLRRDETIGSVRVINPGALGGTQRQSRSVAILDTESGDLRFIELGN